MNQLISKINKTYTRWANLTMIKLRDPSISMSLSGINPIIRRKLAGISTVQRVMLKWAAAAACSTRALLNTTPREPSMMTWPRLSMVRRLETKSPTLSSMKRTKRIHRLLSRWRWMPKTRMRKLTYKSRDLHQLQPLSRCRSRHQPLTLDQPLSLDQPRPQDQDQGRLQNRPRDKHLPLNMDQSKDKHPLQNQPPLQPKHRNKLRPQPKPQLKSLNCKRRLGPQHQLPNPLRLLTRHNRASLNFQCPQVPPPSLQTRTRGCNSASARKRRKRRISSI